MVKWEGLTFHRITHNEQECNTVERERHGGLMFWFWCSTFVIRQCSNAALYFANVRSAFRVKTFYPHLTHFLPLWAHYPPQARGWYQIKWQGWSCKTTVLFYFRLSQTRIIVSSVDFGHKCISSRWMSDCNIIIMMMLEWNKSKGKTWSFRRALCPFKDIFVFITWITISKNNHKEFTLSFVLSWYSIYFTCVSARHCSLQTAHW